MDDATHLDVIAWLRQQMTARGLSLADLADRATVPINLLRRVFEGDDRSPARLTVRQTFSLADALETDPAELINELKMVSEQGKAYIPYCAATSEAPLGEFWETAKHLPVDDRTVLLEYVLHQRRHRWNAT
ncbi:MAG: helix-turn-helix domain-containing protein [Anaerolineae bacterium]|nr:helix-turn-helix domain-containing protein [Anaerolineae bacterium]